MTHWHVYAVEWTPSSIDYFCDGNKVYSYDASSHEGVGYMTKDQVLMMNFWSPTWSPWGDSFDTSKFPYYTEYDYVKTWKYDQSSGSFTEDWTDNFDSFDSSRWLKSNNWGFDGNRITFMSSQVYTDSGSLVIKMDWGSSSVSDSSSTEAFLQE